MRTLLTITGFAAALVLAFGLLTSSENIADYSPRKNQGPSADASGAAEVHRMLRGNLETGEIDDQDYIRLRQAVNKFAKETAFTKASNPIPWQEMGPDNVGGRSRAILMLSETHLMVGAVSGGLWESTNGGDSWDMITSFPSCMIGSIAQAGNGDIYVGTGSMFDFAGGAGGSGFMGRGVYRSTDLGATWSILEDTDPGFASTGEWTAVDALIADPNNPNRVYVGSNAGFGFIEGETVTMGADGLPNQSCQDINIATDGSYMLVSMGSARVYRSTSNAFNSFEPVFGSNNDPTVLPQSGMGRARVRVAPGHPDKAYVLFATTGGLFGGVYHSTNAGQTWTNIWPSGIPDATPLPRGQGIYDLTIGVSPTNPEIAFVGGIEFWRVGPNYQAELAALPFTLASLPITMHVDIHEIEFSPEGIMWVLNDGGIYRSNDQGETYIPSNRGFITTQFYGIAHAPTDAVVGGTQDNGSPYIPNDGSFISDLSSIMITGGDGFDAAIPQITDAEEAIAFTTSQYGVLYRAVEGVSVDNIYDDRVMDLANEDGEIGQFYTTIELYEDTEDELSEKTVRLVNPFEETVTDSTFVLNTNSLGLPLSYTLPEGEELRFWPELIREELTLDEPITEDPTYPWLDPQELTELLVDCDTTQTQIGEQEVIDTITPIDTCIYIEVIDDIMCFEIGADTTYIMEPIFETEVTCDTSYFYAADTLLNVREAKLIQDPYTVMLAIGFRGSEGVWMTREALNFNVAPQWFRLGNAPGGAGVKDIKFVVGDHPEAGDVMFVSGWNGQLWRVTGLRNLQEEGDDIDENGDNYADALEWDMIHSSGGAAVTGIAIDPNDPNHVVITIGTYGNPGQGKVRETFNALGSSPSFSNIWFSNNEEIGRMPCYDVVIDVTDESGQTIVVGAEYGIWVTNDGGDTWAMSNEGMITASDVFACPVFDLLQQWRGNSRWSYPTNSGVIYAGTHGRGIFRSGEFAFVSVEENDEPAANDRFNVFPNPVTSGILQARFELNTSTDVRMSIYSITGAYVKEIPMQKLAQGQHTIVVDVADLPNGNYILAAEVGAELKTSKFVVLR